MTAVPQLVALDLPGGSTFVDALRRVWDRGDAAFPLDQRLPVPARRALLDTMRPAAIITADGREQRRAGGHPVDEGDALVVATSGSTGEPKGVVLTHRAVAASAEATSRRLGVTERDHWLACLPLSHVGGLSVITRALVTGTALSVLPGFDATAVVAAPGHGVTLVSLVGTALARVDVSRFRCVVLGGSSSPPDRPDNVVVTYGMTETGSGVVYDGRPLDGVEVRLADDGEVFVRGPMLLRAYRDGSSPLDAAGWLATGDLGRWLPDGRLHVHGRRSDLIITGGENVFPDAVERVLRDHPGVGDVMVAGSPDPEWGHIVVAVVVPVDTSTPPTLDALRDAVKQQLPAYSAPRRLDLVDHIDRSSLGKPRRHTLA